MAAQNFKLFLGCLGNGVTVCNSAVMEDGDFKMVAHISNEGKITWYVGEDYPPADALASIRACAEQERVKYETWLNGLSPAARREYQLERLPLPEFLEELRKAKEEGGGSLMSRDIHDYDSLKEAYNDLLMFERFPGPAHSERVEEFVIQLKRDIREYIHRDSDYRIVRDELDSFVELVELPDYTADYSEERALLWFKMYRSYRLFDELGCGGQFFTTGVKLFRRRGRWYAYHFVSVDM
jgi:hypothetical protein